MLESSVETILFCMMDTRLKSLVLEAKRQSSDELPIDLKPLAQEILKLRSLCRPAALALNVSVFLETYDALHNQLLADLQKALIPYDGERPPVRQWAVECITTTCQYILSDLRLKAIALYAQSTGEGSRERQIAFTELVQSIRLSGKLAYPHRGKFSPQFYDLLYEEAVNQTLTYICRKIALYDPQRSERFMTWVNFRLDKMVIEARRSFSDRDQQELPDLNDLNQIPQSQTETSLATVVQDHIRADPEQIFQAAHIRNRPEVNFQAIALARFQGASWDDLSARYDLKIPTLSSFFQRSCQKFAPHFQAHCLS